MPQADYCLYPVSEFDTTDDPGSLYPDPLEPEPEPLPEPATAVWTFAAACLLQSELANTLRSLATLAEMDRGVVCEVTGLTDSDLRVLTQVTLHGYGRVSSNLDALTGSAH